MAHTTPHTAEAKRDISDALKLRWQKQREAASLVVYAAHEAIRALEQVEAWANGDGPLEAEDEVVDSACAAIELLKEVVAEWEGR